GFIVAPSGTATGTLFATKVGSGALSYAAMGVNGGSTMATVNLDNAGNVSYTPIVTVGQDFRDTFLHSITDNIPTLTTATVVVEFSPVLTVPAQFVSYNKSTRFANTIINGGTSPFVAQWSPTTNLTNSATLQPSATLITDATYSLQVQDGYGFGGTTNVPVRIHPLTLAFSNSSSTGTTGLPGLINSGNNIVMRYGIFRKRTGQLDSTDGSVQLRVDATAGGNARFAVNYTKTFTLTNTVTEPGITINWLNAPLSGGTTQAVVTLFRTSGAPMDAAQVTVTISSNATAPIITSFAPSIGGNGTTVTVTGANFANVNNVRFGGVAAQSFTVISPTEIRANVGAGVTGIVSVVTMVGVGNSAGVFSFVQPPTLTMFSPTQGVSGATVRITGTNFVQPVTVRIGGVLANNIDVTMPTELYADVGTGATGNISVTTPGGTATSATIFTFFGAPTIGSIAPTQGTAKDTITVTGNNFLTIDSVRIGGVTLTGANGTVLQPISPTQLRILLDTTALSGAITIFALAGQATSSQAFTYIPPPKIDTISPRLGGAGTLVTVSGKNFVQVDSVTFNKARLSNLLVSSPTKLTVTMPNGLANSTGAIVVWARAGRDSSKTPNLFQYAQAPTITAFTAAAGAGAWVQITGANLVGVNGVNFGGIKADSVLNISPTLVLAKVASGGASGKIDVFAAGGSAKSTQDFRFLRAPTLTAFTPSSGATGASVEITGTEFVNVTNVSVGGIAVANFSVASDTRIVATLSNNATSGTIRVTTLQGQALSATAFQVIIALGPPPSIVSFTPISAEAGAEVFISGQNFTNTSLVQFGGVPAASFRVVSPTLIAAIVPSAATTGSVRVTTPNGVAASVANFRFIAPSDGGVGLTPLQRDSTVLVRFYNSTGGGAWLNERHWLTDAPLSSWAGVSVTNGQVTALVLPNNALLGALPTLLAELPALRVLDLTGNQLSGILPSSIATIKTLEVLRLRRNQFTGAVPVISMLANLQVLDLGNNRFAGDLPRGICTLTALREIYLDSNAFSGAIPSCIGDLKRVEILNMSENLLADTLPATIGSMTALREFLLPGNQLTGSIPQTLGTQATLTLASGAMEKNGAALQAVPNLQRLELHRNRLTGVIPSSLGDCRALRTLNLGQNRLTGNIPLSFGNLRALQTLDLSRNQISGVLPTFWGNLTALQSLSLRANTFSGAIPLEIGRLNALTTMWLDSNAFTSLSDSVRNLASLQRLSLANNRLRALPSLRRTSGVGLDSVNVANNALTFESLERNFVGVRSAVYVPQDSVLTPLDTTVRVFLPFQISSTVGGGVNTYQWYKGGRLLGGAVDSLLRFSRVVRSDTGEYTCYVRNTLARDLTLIRRTVRVSAAPPQAPLERPMLLTPQNAAQSVSITPTLVWTTTALTSSYEIEVAQQSDFSSQATVRLLQADPFRARLTLTSAQALTHLKTYFWRARAVSEGLAGVWSDVGRFTTLPEGRTVNVETVNFGRGILRKPTERLLTVQNLSGVAILLQYVRIAEPSNQAAGQFSMNALSSAIRLEPDSAVSLPIRFTPNTVGEQVASVLVGYTVASSGSSTPIELSFASVLSGTGGALAFTGTEVDFGTLTAGLPKTENVQLINVGTAPLSLTPSVLSSSENSSNATFGLNDQLTNTKTLEQNQSFSVLVKCNVNAAADSGVVRGNLRFVAQIGVFSDTLTVPMRVNVRKPDVSDVTITPTLIAEEQGVAPGGVVTLALRLDSIDYATKKSAPDSLRTLYNTAGQPRFSGEITLNRQVLVPVSDENSLVNPRVNGDIITYSIPSTSWVPNDKLMALEPTILRFRCRVVAGSTDTSALRVIGFQWDTTKAVMNSGNKAQVIVRLDTTKRVFVAGASRAGGKRLITGAGSMALTLSPNPSGDAVALGFTTKAAETVDVEVLTLQGTVVMRLSERHFSEGAHTLAVPISSLASGVYLVRLRTSAGELVDERLQVVR
ncbi:MAG: leucine-rich repeat domain-containing protein, partial [Candidatus Kapaibacteriota bacterium]